MAKKKTKKTKKTGSSAGLACLTRQQMLDGVPGPDGVRIGFAVPEEVGTVTVLLKTAADDLKTGHLEGLARGRCGMSFPSYCGDRDRRDSWRSWHPGSASTTLSSARERYGS